MKKQLSAFEVSVLEGLSSKIKKLSSSYFYDDEGSRLFQEIMNLPEYYLTNAEFDILKNQSDAIYRALPFEKNFNIVELGAGDGKKTIELLRYLENESVPFTYVPIDISAGALESLGHNVSAELPTISIRPLVGDYWTMLHELKSDNTPMLLLFLGSNIGNFNAEQAQQFISNISNNMHAGDALLIGVDLQKNPHTIAKAYNDSAGVTRAFNLNLLKRINNELGGNFNMAFWDFYSTYNPLNGEVRSFIISLKEQEVYIRNLDQSFSFMRNELIYTELSRKYTEEELEQLASQNDLHSIEFFYDNNRYFTDFLVKK